MGTEGSTVLQPLRQGRPPFGAGTVSGSASCALPPRNEAVKEARDFTRAVLQRWELTAHYDSVALVVSELVTNALRHGLPTAVSAAGNPTVRLHLMHWSARLVCAVRDPSQQAPVLGTADFSRIEDFDDYSECDGYDECGGCDSCGRTAHHGHGDAVDVGGYMAQAPESGRGLFLVDSFSDSWGWQALNGSMPGKLVWALFRLNPGGRLDVTPV